MALREPEVARLDVAPAGTALQRSASGVPRMLSVEQRALDGEPLLTNPLAYFTFADGRFVAHNLLHNTVCEIDEDDFAVLTHCIRSHRGAPSRSHDRRTCRADLTAAVPGADERKLSRLAAQGLLLGTGLAEPLYGEVRRWSEAGWYLTLLAWQEATAVQPPAETRMGSLGSQPTRAELSNIFDLPSGLQRRVTTRRFESEPVDLTQVTDLLEAAYAASGEAVVNCCVAPLAVTGVREGTLYDWDVSTRRLECRDTTISANDVVKITIGQDWVRRSAAMIWFVTHVDRTRPDRYLDRHVLLGRMAQRICVRAAELGFGVFQTPATRDSLLCNTLGLEHDAGLVSYSVAVGWPSKSDSAIEVAW